MTSTVTAGGRVTRWLETASPAAFTLYAVVAAFSTYFAMYAFRKPFAVGKFTGSVHLYGAVALDHKTLFIVSQVIGYAASKFFGIKIISELSPSRRARAIVLCIAIAELGLVMFGLLPAPYSAVGMLLDGLPLGMVWGLVFGFLEGRRVSDLLGAGLCASFIVASGFVKTAGKMVIDAGISERWMPAITGLLFLPALLGAVWMLAQIPPPNSEDERMRTKRAPMDSTQRRAFFGKYALGLVVLVLGYVILTTLRDFRDNFARELWDTLGFSDQPAIMTTTELPVAVGALLPVVLIMAIRDNRRALYVMHAVMIAGVVLAGVTTLMFQRGWIGPVTWMISVGLGLYIAYVPFNCVLYDRLIAATGTVGTAGFLIYVSDAAGYFGSTSLLLAKSFGKPKLAWLSFFETVALLTAAVCTVLFVVSAVYFGAHEAAWGVSLVVARTRQVVGATTSQTPTPAASVGSPENFRNPRPIIVSTSSSASSAEQACARITKSRRTVRPRTNPSGPCPPSSRCSIAATVARSSSSMFMPNV